jgi:hypothetical protein
MRNWFVFVLVVSAGVSHAALSAQQRAPVIDMHMHAHHIPLNLPAGAPPPCLPRPCQPEGSATATPDESLRKTLEAMDRHNIVLGFLSGADLGIVQNWVAAAPGRFIASPFIEKPGELTPQMLRQEYAAKRLAGMGEIGSQLVGVAPNDPALAPYFALAEEFDVPVLIHTEGIGPPLPGFRSAAGRRVLVPGGRVAIATWRSLEDHPGVRDLNAVAERHVGRIADARHSFGDATALKNLLAESGFRHVNVQTVTHDVQFADGALFARLNAMAVIGMSEKGKSMNEAQRGELAGRIAAESQDVIAKATKNGTFVLPLSTNIATAAV